MQLLVLFMLLSIHTTALEAYPTIVEDRVADANHNLHPCRLLYMRMNIPAVALLFMAKGPLPLEPLWKAWLQSVQGHVPRRRAVCPRGQHACRLRRHLQQAMHRCLDTMPGSGSSNAAPSFQLEHQPLFTLYAHVVPSAGAVPPSSLLYGRTTRKRLETVRFEHSMVRATKYMLEEALLDSRNQRFVVLSDSHIPLYPAALLYRQVLSEPLARVQACEHRPVCDDGGGWGFSLVSKISTYKIPTCTIASHRAPS